MSPSHTAAVFGCGELSVMDEEICPLGKIGVIEITAAQRLTTGGKVCQIRLVIRRIDQNGSIGFQPEAESERRMIQVPSLNTRIVDVECALDELRKGNAG